MLIVLLHVCLHVYSILSEITESLTKQYIDDSLLYQTNNTRSFIENSLNLHTNLFIIHAVFELTGADPTQVTSRTLCGPHHICLKGGYCLDYLSEPPIYANDTYVEIHTSEPPGEISH